MNYNTQVGNKPYNAGSIYTLWRRLYINSISQVA